MEVKMRGEGKGREKKYKGKDGQLKAFEIQRDE